MRWLLIGSGHTQRGVTPPRSLVRASLTLARLLQPLRDRGPVRTNAYTYTVQRPCLLPVEKSELVAYKLYTGHAEEPQKNPKQATGVVSSLEGSQARRCAEAAPHAQRLKHCAVSMNLVSSMPTTLTVSSAGTFPRRVVVQRESNVSQPGKRLAAAGAERAEGSSKKRDQTRPHTSRTACGEAAIAEGFLRLLARATPRCGVRPILENGTIRTAI